MSIIFNGDFLDSNTKTPLLNRGILYSDSVLEWFTINNKEVVNLEEHYFNLCASMRIQRMSIPSIFTQDFFEESLLKLAAKSTEKVLRIRFQAIRGFSNLKEVDFFFLEEKSHLSRELVVDVYKDYLVGENLYDRILKPNSAESIAAIYIDENQLDDLILLNTKKRVARTLLGNIFLIQQQKIITPKPEEGVLVNVTRDKMIQHWRKTTNFQVVEQEFFPFELSKSDFALVLSYDYQILPIKQFRKKKYPHLEFNFKQLGL